MTICRRRVFATQQFRRWRLDKKPQECTFDQLEIVPPHELTTIFASGR
jgi:hypothetical protein